MLIFAPRASRNRAFRMTMIRPRKRALRYNVRITETWHTVLISFFWCRRPGRPKMVWNCVAPRVLLAAALLAAIVGLGSCPGACLALPENCRPTLATLFCLREPLASLQNLRHDGPHDSPGSQETLVFLRYYMGSVTFDIPMIAISRSCKESFPWMDMSYALRPQCRRPSHL